MNMPVKKHAITIADEYYSMISDEPETVIAEAVVQLNETIGAIAGQANFVDKKRIATLAALQLSVQLIQVKNQLTAIERAQREIVCAIDQANL